MLISHYMTKDPVTVSPSDTLEAADEKMRANGFRRLPVMDAGQLVGILSDRDLREHKGYFHETRVTAAMTEDPITVSPLRPLTEAARTMLDRKLDSLPVVDGDKLVGIVTTSDILAAYLEISARSTPDAD